MMLNGFGSNVEQGLERGRAEVETSKQSAEVVFF